MCFTALAVGSIPSAVSLVNRYSPCWRADCFINSLWVKICAEVSHYEHFCHVLHSFLNPNWKASWYYTGVISLERIKFELQFCSAFTKFRKYVNVLLLLEADTENTLIYLCTCLQLFPIHYCVQIAVRKVSKLVCIRLVLLKFPQEISAA